jgi:2-haloacid dehalogenase
MPGTQEPFEAGTRPSAVLLDVNGTLFPVTAASPVFKELGFTKDTDAVVQHWFSCVLRDAFGAQCAGTFVPFQQLAKQHLSSMHGATGNKIEGRQLDEAVQKLVAAWQQADVFGDVREGLEAMHVTGITLAALTNGSEAIARGVLEKAGLAKCVQHVFDINMAGAWKPHRRAYEFAVQQLGYAPNQVMLIASHPWDVHGALSAGLRAVYVQRTSETYPSYFDQPEVVLGGLNEVCTFLGY